MFIKNLTKAPIQFSKWDVNPNNRQKVTLDIGENEITDEQYKILENDRFFLMLLDEDKLVCREDLPEKKIKRTRTTKPKLEVTEIK